VQTSQNLSLKSLEPKDKFGKVVDVMAKAPHPKLEKEALRVARLLPDMTPGKQGGKDVAVLFSLPIIFEIRD
jgi:protein TonB